MSPKRSAPQPPEITSHFKFIALIVLGLTIISGGTYGSLALLVSNPSDEVKTLMTVASAGWTSGIGAFFGLLGGKAIQ